MMAIATSPRVYRNKDDLFKSMRILLCFGRLIGFVPISGLFYHDLNRVQAGNRTLARITSTIVVVALVIFALLFTIGFFNVGGHDPIGIARGSSAIVFAYIGLYVSVYMYRNSGKLLDCFHRWRGLSTTFYQEDKKLFLHINLIAGIIFTSGILENVCSYWKVIAIHNSKDPAVHLPWPPHQQPSSIWETFWWIHHNYRFASLFSYNRACSMFIFLSNKWCLYAWNFGDIFISVIARALYQRFHLNYRAAKIAAMERDNLNNPKFWDALVRDHEKLTELLQHFSDLLSPLIFSCSAANIFFVGLTLFNFLEATATASPIINNNENSGNSTRSEGAYLLSYEGVDLTGYLLWHRIYQAWAFLHLLARTLAVFVCCARVNECAHQIINILEKCPVPCLTNEVERLDFRLRTTETGLTGLRFFTITKPLILNVVNVIVTLEIVLLQSSNLIATVK